MFVKRAIVTLTLGPLLIVLVNVGGWLYFWPFILVLTVATFEYSQIFKAIGWRVPFLLLLPLLFALWLNAFLTNFQHDALILTVALLATLVYSLWLYESQADEFAFHSWLALMAGIILVGWLGSHFFLIRGLDEMAPQWTMLTFLVTWFADTGAYLVGRFVAGHGIFRRHAMTPRLSPKKSVEGLVGGSIVATAVSLALSAYFNIPLSLGAILGITISIVSPIGDLSISMLKRVAGVKDSGILFPGHGGALDRIDSMIWSVPVGYYLAIVLFERFF